MEHIERYLINQGVLEATIPARKTTNKFIFLYGLKATNCNDMLNNKFWQIYIYGQKY